MPVMGAATRPAVLGIDVGGTKSTAAMVASGRLLRILEQPTPLGSNDGDSASLGTAARQAIRAGGTALERDAREVAAAHPESALAKGPIDGKSIVAAADAGDEHALALFDRLGMLFGVGLCGAINTFEPQHIVVGGGLSRAAHLFF